MDGALITVDPSRTRVRVLPFPTRWARAKEPDTKWYRHENGARPRFFDTVGGVGATNLVSAQTMV